MGRPRKIASPEEAWEKGEQYFSKCAAEERPTTITGLVYALGLSSRQSLMEYEHRPEFSDTIKILKLRVEMVYEERLFGAAPAGAIFGLKNFGWRDQPIVEDDKEPLQDPNPDV